MQAYLPVDSLTALVIARLGNTAGIYHTYIRLFTIRHSDYTYFFKAVCQG